MTPYKENFFRRLKAGLFSRHSHPIATANCTVGIRGVHTSTGSAFKHLTARAGNGVGLGNTRLNSIGARCTSLVILLRIGLTSGLSNGLGVLLVFVDSPIKDIVILEAFADKEIAENLTEVAIVGLVVEAKGSSVVEVDGKLVGEAATKHLSRGCHLLLHDAIVFLLLGCCLETLPGERAAAEVKHDVPERLHVITARLLDTQVCVDGSITSGTGQVLVLAVSNMEESLGIAELLGQTKINHVDLVATLANAHKEVIGLNVTVNE